MTLRKLIPLTALPILTALAAGTGCQHPAAAASPQESLPETPAPFATAPVLPGTPDIATLAARVRPAVVNITTVHEVHMPRGDFGFPGFGDLLPFFNQGHRGHLPGGESGEGEGDAVQKQQALGSGFLIDAQGHVVTNAHVVDDADLVKVKLADDREYRAKVVGKDARLDVAVLKLENPPTDLPVTALGSSDALRVGEYVVAIGNPFGLGNTVTMGIVSAKGRTIGAGPYDDFIQTDASINPGNSGGPLFNLRGQVVGINTAIIAMAQGICFAVPSNTAQRVVSLLIRDGRVIRSYLGITGETWPIHRRVNRYYQLEQDSGVRIARLDPNGPAQTAGLQKEDVLVGLATHSMKGVDDLQHFLTDWPVGIPAEAQVLRGTELLKRTIIPTELRS